MDLEIGKEGDIGVRGGKFAIQQILIVFIF